MKVMDVSIEEQNCSIEMVTPPRKKLKQALLPYHMRTGPLGPSMAMKNKKRKLDSPSPVERKSPRTSQGVTKQNSAKRVKGSEVEVIELTLTDDEEDVVVEESCKAIKVEEKKDSKECLEEENAAKFDEKIEKDNESEVKKKRDYNVLHMFLKKAQSKEAKDDIQLLAMSDYESGNSKDSDGSLKAKPDGLSAKETSEEVVLIQLDSKTQIENKAVAESEERQSDEKSDKDVEPKPGDKENEAGSLEIKNLDTDSTSKEKGSVTSDDNDVKNVDSDSDIGVLSSDDDVDDEPDKSGNENDKDKDKAIEGDEESKTPRSEASNSLRNRKLTPKQIERRVQSAKKREEKQRMKQEKERKREEERENRRKEKEQKRKEKEMKDLKKQIETEQKQKEKEAKEEERRKREEEKLEAERKKQKAAHNFANFFVAKKQESKPTEEDTVVKDQNFMPFEVKGDMRVAPITRRNLNQKNKLNFEGLFNKGVSETELYLNKLKLNPNAVGRSEKTWPYEAKDDVVVIDEDDGSSDAVDPGSGPIAEKHHPKLFMFAENRRPPFWGTWRKKSDHINPRRPFAKDSKWFDYDVDSDDEWEEEEPGESIRGSDDERDEEGPEENEYDVDNDFMVPHGYLSDEEAKADEEDGEDMSPETQKLKLKLLGEQFEAERKTKTSRIKPKVIGCVWQGAINSYPENTAPNVVKILLARQAWTREIPIILSPISSSISESLLSNTLDCGSPATNMSGGKKKRVPEDAIPNLIRLVHGNINSRIFLIKEFISFWEKNKTGDVQISKSSLSLKIKEIAAWMACPEEGPMHLRSCWYVREEVRKEYNCIDVKLPNRWEYTLRPTRKSDVLDIDKPEKIDKDKKRIPLITQFTKKITQEEKQKQLIIKPTTSQIKPPKRVALISVPRGEQFTKSSESFLSKFVDLESVENKDSKLTNEKKLTGIDKVQEIHDLDDSDDEESKCTIKNAIVDEKIEQTSTEDGVSIIENKKEVAEGSKSVCDDTDVQGIKDTSLVGIEPMETEKSNVDETIEQTSIEDGVLMVENKKNVAEDSKSVYDDTRVQEIKDTSLVGIEPMETEESNIDETIEQTSIEDGVLMVKNEKEVAEGLKSVCDDTEVQEIKDTSLVGTDPDGN